jgi:hypothetical protein
VDAVVCVVQEQGMLAWYAWAIAGSLAPNATQDAPGRVDRESATLRSTTEAENGLMREDGVQRQLACDNRMFRDQQDGLRRWLVRRRSKVDKGLRKTRTRNKSLSQKGQWQLKGRGVISG